jgi:hypothetical protein
MQLPEDGNPDGNPDPDPEPVPTPTHPYRPTPAAPLNHAHRTSPS